MHMTRSIWLGVLASLAVVLVASTPVTAQPQKPNVVFILADNVGYGDLGPYGGGELRGAPTPRSDQLAREGLRLTHYLVEAACSPSRAALMTGQYSIRNGLSLVVIPNTPNTLSARAVTMGDLFHGAGYATAIFGEWHLGKDPQSLPTAHGFDEFYGIPPDESWDSAFYVDTIELTHLSPRRATCCWRRDRRSTRRWPAARCARSSRTLPRSGPRSITSWWLSRLTS
jgi:arylsulfatase